MKINHAILHVFDFIACSNTYAREEIDLSNKYAKGYVTKHARKALNNLDNMRGEFANDSMFAGELRTYFRGERDFVDLSCQIGEYIAGELGHMEKPASTDLLVIDFEDDTDQNVREMTEEEAAAAYEGRGKRYFALLMLESKQAYMHEVDRGDNGTRNDIVRHYAILPNPSQKVRSYAVIESKTLSVAFTDCTRIIAGEERMLIPDGLLQCSMQASSKDTFNAVTRVIEEVAMEHGANTAVALSTAKAYVSENVEYDEEFSTEDLGREVFGEDTTMRKAFADALADEELPDHLSVEAAVVRRVAKNHKIRTDTGIEITFPAEYSQNSDLMEFVKGPDGLLSIELKNIAHIENR